MKKEIEAEVEAKKKAKQVERIEARLRQLLMFPCDDTLYEAKKGIGIGHSWLHGCSPNTRRR